MSYQAVRGALLTKLATITPDLPTALENDNSEPTSGQPYQRVSFLAATPSNNENTASYGEQGVMQVTLAYPLGEAAGDAVARAELTRATFKKNTSVTQDGIVTNIIRTPEIGPAFYEPDRFCIPVRIRYFASISV